MLRPSTLPLWIGVGRARGRDRRAVRRAPWSSGEAPATAPAPAAIASAAAQKPTPTPAPTIAPIAPVAIAKPVPPPVPAPAPPPDADDRAEEPAPAPEPAPPPPPVVKTIVPAPAPKIVAEKHREPRHVAARADPDVRARARARRAESARPSLDRRAPVGDDLRRRQEARPSRRIVRRHAAVGRSHRQGGRGGWAHAVAARARRSGRRSPQAGHLVMRLAIIAAVLLAAAPAFADDGAGNARQGATGDRQHRLRGPRAR